MKTRDFIQEIERAGNAISAGRTAGDGCAEAACSAPAPRFHRWRIRKELPSGMFTACTYNGPAPVTAEQALASPAVRNWLGTDRLDEVYHPEEPNVKGQGRRASDAANTADASRRSL